MNGDKPDLVKILEIGQFEEDDEILLIHRSMMYALHGLVSDVDKEKSWLNLKDRVKLDYDKMQIVGKADMMTTVKGVNPHDAMGLYEFLRDCKGYRTEATVVFPGKGAWEAYKIVEKKPEPEVQPAPEIPDSPAETEQSL